MQRLYYDEPRTAWKNIVGGDLVLSRGILTVRGNIQSDACSNCGPHDRASASPTESDCPSQPPRKQRIYGVSANLDIDERFVRRVQRLRPQRLLP